MFLHSELNILSSNAIKLQKYGFLGLDGRGSTGPPLYAQRYDLVTQQRVKLSYVNFSAHVKISSRIVYSYKPLQYLVFDELP